MIALGLLAIIGAAVAITWAVFAAWNLAWGTYWRWRISRALRVRWEYRMWLIEGARRRAIREMWTGRPEEDTAP